MQLHLKILHNYVLINTLILQWFSCLNQAFSLNIIYLWSFQPISILDIFQKLQYPLYCYISLFLNNEWSDICEICCMHFNFHVFFLSSVAIVHIWSILALLRASIGLTPQLLLHLLQYWKPLNLFISLFLTILAS